MHRILSLITSDKFVEMHYGTSSKSVKGIGLNALIEILVSNDQKFLEIRKVCKLCQDKCGECDLLETSLTCKEGFFKKVENDCFALSTAKNKMNKSS